MGNIESICNKLLVNDNEISFEQARLKAIDIDNKIKNSDFDLSTFTKETLNVNGKKRRIRKYKHNTTEEMLCHILKINIERIFKIKYPNRNSIIHDFFRILSVLKDLNDFVIVKFDFKDYFESLSTKHIYDTMIKNSDLSRRNKKLLEKYNSIHKHCYPGLCLSNTYAELIGRNFDTKIKMHLKSYGIVFYERYVDDSIIVLNSYISEDSFTEIINATIQEVYGKCKIKYDNPQKYKYISRREFVQEETFNFLGYKFTLSTDISFKFGITEAKLEKYRKLFTKIFMHYKTDKNVELLRQRLLFYGSRIVYREKKLSDENWVSWGLIANYSELRFRTNLLDENTYKFLNFFYDSEMSRLGILKPYFLKGEPSPYILINRLKLNKSLIFDKRIGLSRNDIIKKIRKIDKTYEPANKSYRQVALDYYDKIKV